MPQVLDLFLTSVPFVNKRFAFYSKFSWERYQFSETSEAVTIIDVILMRFGRTSGENKRETLTQREQKHQLRIAEELCDE
jgi:hypothetical protein